MRYIRPSSFAMMKALDPKLMSQSAGVSAERTPPEPKAKKPNRREVMNMLVTESNKTVVLGHLHPRRLRKDYEQ